MPVASLVHVEHAQATGGFRHLGAQPHELAQGNLCLRVASLKSQGAAQLDSEVAARLIPLSA